MDHTYPAISPTAPASQPGTARQRAQTDELIKRLEEMQLRMSIVVYDRRTMRVLIDDLETGCPHMSEDLERVLAGARNHLEVSEKFEDAECQASRLSTQGIDIDQRLQPLLTQVYETWREWQTAHTRLMHRIAATG